MYPDYPPAHGKLGSVALFCCNDVAGAIRHYQDALALDSRDPTVLVNSANAMVKLGRFDQAIAVYEADLRRDPINVNRLSNLAYFYQVAGRYDESIRTFLTVLELAPTRYGARAGLATSQLLGGDPRAALAQYELEKDEGTRLFDLSLAFHALGRKADSDAALAALTAKYEAEYSYQIAEAHAFRGETEDAFAWLDRAVERKDPGLREILETRLFDRIRSDPRWLPFVRKLGKAPEQLAQFKFEVPVPPTIDDAAAVAEQAAKP